MGDGGDWYANSVMIFESSMGSPETRILEG